MIRRAFTLIELMTVMAILVVLAGTVTLNLRAATRPGDIRNVIDSLAAYDHQTRLLTGTRGRPCTLTIDLSNGLLSRAGADPEESWGDAWRLPSPYRLTGAWVGDSFVDYGEIALPFTQGGCTPTYAVHLEGPGGSGAYVMMVGLTGSCVQVQSEEELAEILSVSRRRSDAR